MKKITQAITSLITAMSMTVFVTSESIHTLINDIKARAATNIVYGDVDNNNEIDIFDVVSMRKILSKSGTEQPEADLNGNNVVDAADMYLLQSYVLGKIDSFPIETIEKINNVDRTVVSNNHYELSMTHEMIALADSLKTPLNIYDYLSNNIRTEFYPNSRKGAIGTFELNGGNDIDCASLLIAMLNHVGIKSSYVTGDITLPIDNAMNLTGAHDANSALNIIKLSDTNAVMNSDNSSITFAHTWVSSIIDGKTYNLDCSFKQYAYHDTIFDELNEQYDFKDEQFNINDAIEEQSKCITQKSYLIDKQIVAVNNTQLPEKLPYSNTPTGGYDYISLDNSDTVSFSLAGKENTFTSAELYGKKITLQYEVNSRFVDDEDFGPLYLRSVTEGETIYELMDDYNNDALLKAEGAKYKDMQLVLRIDGKKLGQEILASLGNFKIRK